jgi:hypothetical protein
MPFIIPHEQAGYVEILRNTLVQLVHEPVFGQNANIIITIAHRRSETLYGDGDFTGYETNLSNRLSLELTQSFPVKPKPTISVSFKDARKIPGLLLADFFCGALRNENRNYLKDYKEIRIYPFSKGYSLVGGRAVQQLEFIETIDVVAAAVQCLDMLSADAENLELMKLFQRMYQKLDESMKKSFFESVQMLMNETLVGNPERYAYLDRMKTITQLLRGLLTQKKPAAMSPVELRMMVDIQLNEIRIESHKGRTDVNILKELLSFMDEYGNLAFENQLTLMQRRLDIVLQGIQISTFNTFRFEEVEGILREHRDRYQEMFSKELSRGGVQDNNIARLEGTLGQMDGFLYDFSRDRIYFESAEISLKNDIDACIPGTRVWEQGMGYLTALYWKDGDLEKALPQLLCEGGKPDLKPEDVYDLEQIDLLGGTRKPFIFMHRLNICALAQKKGNTIRNLDAAADFLLKSQRLSQYPEMLSAKWLGILYAMSGNYQQSLTLFDAVLSGGDDSGYTLQVLRLPLKLCKHLVLWKLGKPSEFICEQEVARLEQMQPGTEQLLKNLGIEKFYQNPINWDCYDIGTLLPFYYS